MQYKTTGWRKQKNNGNEIIGDDEEEERELLPTWRVPFRCHGDGVSVSY